ncbi:MAG: alpha/beta hydrolase [Aquabacterium sp.]|jgi:pimeloyl-ACP methyl ester carboxylesterase|uniref:alpha/beta fold hydrolase n=1 Tax=Aquabacterium sp. TaxID=1872578 RepID=UPI001B75FF62|nr:alpha/beta hydrolase [Aquabacterium sp.]MBP7133509.1 alpha/beta hydrolase [Aquabacterium sp.]MDQ5925511.1 hypothetical protein [Pseudomonadota bacterium]
MQLTPWTHTGHEGFALRGWHSTPSGKPLIHFLHGNGLCGRTYEPMLQHLSHDFDLWLCDIQGHGDSDHGGRFVGWNRNAELAVEAFKTQGHALFANVPHLGLGHSLGGILTGMTMGMHQRLFHRTVLLDPVLFSPAMMLGATLATLTGVARLSPMARSARNRRHHWPSRDEAFEQLRHRGVYKTWTAEALHAFVRHALKDAPDGGVELKCQPSREAEVFASAPERLWTLLGRIQAPTLVLHATHTFPFVAEGAARLQSVNPHVQTQQVNGTHCFMQEQPANTAALIKSFLQTT